MSKKLIKTLSAILCMAILLSTFSIPEKSDIISSFSLFDEERND